MSRPVEVSDWVRPEGEKRYTFQVIGQGIFHQFGVGFEEFEAGPGNFSTAIVEMPDGTVKNVQVNQIRFLDTNDREGVPTP